MLREIEALREMETGVKGQSDPAQAQDQGRVKDRQSET
jgi:hypothetical protein